MKKYVIIFLLLILNTPVISVLAEINPPKWEDRCPKEYVNAKYDNNIYWTGVAPEAGFWRAEGELLLYYSIVGWPIIIKRDKKHKLQLVNNYWVRKKELFDKELKFCSTFDNQLQKDYCYKVLNNNYSHENNMKE